jgi:RHS repeat-associated protein
VFFYHADHLGSTSFVTDEEGELYEHAQYFPFGEQWVLQQGSQDLPYLFTSKELDEETGLYYFGARYYDPRTSVWQSPDPALPEYLALQVQPPSAPLEGVARPVNLALYSYCHLRPLIMRDPDGRDPVRIVPGQKCEVAECEVVYFIPLPDGTTVVQSVGVIARGATAVASSAWAWVAATPLGLKAKDIVDRVAPRWPRPT